VPSDLVRRIAVICYEAEMNVILHSLGGYMDVEMLPDRVRIRVVDEGPGIPDIEKAMQPGYTTANEKIRALGFGAGMGLPNIKRCADDFSISSSMETGTELEATVHLPALAMGVALPPVVEASRKEAARDR
jgi:anti-sigma regulatory factor (Ser/Thr protein kinase)